MNRTRYLISLLGLCTALVAPMHGQVTRAAFNTATDALLEDDGPAEEITPEAIGTLIKSLAASSHLALTDGTVVVTSGSYADPTWLTGLAWSKIGTTPTTLSGYGITDAQGLDTDLTTWASLTPSANAQSLVTAANYAAMRALLDLEVGTDFYSIAAADAAFDAAGSAATAQSAVQADVDQNETDADAAIAAVQADVDQNETDADAAIAAVQNDVDQNESDADTAIAAVQNDVDQNETDADNAIALKQNADADLDDVADGSLSGWKVGPGISGANVTLDQIIPNVLGGGGSANQILRRNAGNTASEWVDASGGGGDVLTTDIDSLAELNAILGDATLVDISDINAAAGMPKSYLVSDGDTANRRLAFPIDASTSVAGYPITLLIDMEVPSSSVSGTANIFALTSSATGGDFIDNIRANTLWVQIQNSSLRIKVTGATSSDYRLFTNSSFRSDYSGRNIKMAITFLEGNTTLTPVIQVDGETITSDFSESTNGTTNWMDADMDATTMVVGHNWPKGRVPTVIPLNFPLLAADALAWTIDGGLPRIATVAGDSTPRISGGNSTFDSDTGYWETLGATAFSGGQITGMGGGAGRSLFRNSFFRAETFFFLRLIATNTSSWRFGWAKWEDDYSYDPVIAGGDAEAGYRNGSYNHWIFGVGADATSSTERRLGFFSIGGSAGDYTADSIEGWYAGSLVEPIFQAGSLIVGDRHGRSLGTLVGMEAITPGDPRTWTVDSSGELTTSTAVNLTDDTSSTNTTTGAAVIGGGLGVAENINAGGNVTGVDGTFSGNVTAPNLVSQFAARSPDSGIVFTGSASGTVSVIPDLKGSDWTLEYDVVVGSAYGGVNGFGLLGEDSGNDNAVRPAISGTGSVAVYIRAVTTSSYISSSAQLELNTAYKVAYTFIDSTKVLSMYVNGVSVYSAALSGSGLSEYNAIPTLDYLRVGGYASQPFPGTMLGSRLWNKALTAAEVLTLHQYGWAALPQYVHPGGISDGVSWDLSADLDGWSATGSASISFSTDHAAVEVTTTTNAISATGTLGSLGLGSASGGFAFHFYIDYRNITAGKTLSLFDSASGSSFATLVPGWNTFIFPSGRNPGGSLRIKSTDNSAVTFDFYSAELIQAGVAGSWDFSTGVGIKQQDESGAGNTMTLSATGVQRLRANDIQTIKSPNGTVYKLEVANDGTLSATAL